MKTLPFVILLTLILASCGRSYDSRLLGLETELEVCPDSVLTVLDSLPASSLRSDGDRALYGLLLTRARHKNYIDETDDSLISASVDYFRRHNDRRHLMKALYLKAYIALNSSDYISATAPLLESEEIASELNDYEYLARIKQRYSDIYQVCCNTDEAYRSSTAAERFFTKAGLEREANFSKVETAMSVFNSGQFGRSERILDSLIHTLDESDPSLTAYAYNVLMSSQLRQNKFDSAEISLRKLRETGVCIDPAGEQIAEFEIALSRGALLQASSILDSLGKLLPDTSSSVRFLEARYELLFSEGLIGAATVYADSLTSLQHGELREAMRQPINNARSVYYEVKADREKRHKERLGFLLTGIISITLLIGVLIMLYVRNIRTKMRLKQLAIENKMMMIKELNGSLKSKETDLAALSTKIETKDKELAAMEKSLSEINASVDELYNRQFETLNRLCGEYFSKRDTDTVRLTLYNEVEKEILSLKSPQKMKALETTLDRYRDNIVSRLDDEIPSLKRVDRLFLILSFAGLSSKAVCIITDLSIANYYNKRKRLKEKIELSEAPSKSLFLKYLG